jgi:hypothetical protein
MTLDSAGRQRSEVNALRLLLAVSLLFTAGCGEVPQPPSREAPALAKTTVEQVRKLDFVDLGGDEPVSWSGPNHVVYGADPGDVYRVSLDGSSRQHLGSVRVGLEELASDADGTLITAVGFEQITTWTSDGRLVRDVPAGIAEVLALQYSDDGTTEVYASSVVSTHNIRSDVTSVGRPAENDRGYLDVKIDGKEAIAWPGTDNSLDIWDISGARPVRTQRQNCGCGAVHRAALSRQAPLVAMTSDDGYLVVWDYRKNDAIARKVVARTSADRITPLAFLNDNVVLFTLSAPQDDGEAVSPLMALNLDTNAVDELWKSPGEVTDVWPDRSGGSILMKVITPGGLAPTLWLGSVHTG